MKVQLVEIMFSEALFKVHYTKGFRLTYPTPLPTTVAGFFGALLGIQRGELKDHFSGRLFGAKLLDYKGFVQENVTYLQVKGGKPVKGIALTMLINSPRYLIAMAGDPDSIYKANRKLRDGFIFLPYGGQNDYFAEDWAVYDVKDLNESDLVESYAPQDLVVEPVDGTKFNILPVKHRYFGSLNFYFVQKGALRLKRKVPCVDGIAMYPLDKFYYLPA